MILYIYDNELLGENGDQFNDNSLVDEIQGASNEECEAIFDERYSSNDYTASYTRHQ